MRNQSGVRGREGNRNGKRKMIDVSKLTAGSKIYEPEKWGSNLYREATVLKVTAKQVKINGASYKTTVNDGDKDFFNTEIEVLESIRNSAVVSRDFALKQANQQDARISKIEEAMNKLTQSQPTTDTGAEN